MLLIRWKRVPADVIAPILLFVPIELVKWLMFHFARAEVIYVFVAVPIFLLAYYRSALSAVIGIVFTATAEFFLYEQPMSVLPTSATFLSATILMVSQQAIIIFFAVRWRKAAEKLKLSNRGRDILLGTLGHDLRTPITSIKHTTELLHKRGAIDAESARRLNSGCNRLVRTIEHVVDMAAMHRGGGIKLYISTFDMVEVAQRVIEETLIVHPKADIRLVTKNPTIEGNWDETRVERALSNLLSNACKYGRPGSPIIMALEEDDHAIVTISVRNEGDPIPPEMIAVLFNPFERCGVKSSKMMGVGLGLYITAEMIDKHGGTITVQSTELTGTTFTIRLPRVCH